MKRALVSLVVLAVASVASADLIWEVTTNASPGAGLASYTVWFKGVTPGDALAAFVGRIDGPLHQAWGDYGFYLKTIYGDSNPMDNKDTRLLIPAGNVTSVAEYLPDEDAALPPPSGVMGKDAYCGNCLPISRRTSSTLIASSLLCRTLPTKTYWRGIRCSSVWRPSMYRTDSPSKKASSSSLIRIGFAHPARSKMAASSIEWAVLG